MFSSENVHSLDIVIDADPTADGEKLMFWRVPRGVTVVGARMVAKVAQNAGTAVQLTLQNWGTAGTAVKSGTAGTVAATLGGTASASRLSAYTPAAATLVAPSVAQGEYLVLLYNEQGAGWVANDRFNYQIDYVVGLSA